MVTVEVGVAINMSRTHKNKRTHHAQPYVQPSPIRRPIIDPLLSPWSTPDKHFSCDKKNVYLTEKEALAAVKFMKKKKKVLGLESYKCRHCEFWHVGHGREHKRGTSGGTNK